jgi:hypothetical protein
MGKCFIRPRVQRSLNSPPKLTWYNIYLGDERAGDLLASFELINVGLLEDFVNIIAL